MIKAFSLRVSEATQDAFVRAAVNVNNGDTALYADKGGTYTKGLPHDNFGRVDLNAFATFTKALRTGKFSDFEKITMGGTRTLNGPQGGLAFDLEALDSVQFGQPQVPPPPPLQRATKAPPSCSNITGLRSFVTSPSPTMGRRRSPLKPQPNWDHYPAI